MNAKVHCSPVDKYSQLRLRALFEVAGTHWVWSGDDELGVRCRGTKPLDEAKVTATVEAPYVLVAGRGGPSGTELSSTRSFQNCSNWLFLEQVEAADTQST